MTQLKASLKLNFLSRKIAALIVIILFGTVYFVVQNYGQHMYIEKWYVLQEISLFLYAYYAYKSAFNYWVSIGGKRKSFYLGTLILFILTAAVLSSFQVFTFNNYVLQKNMAPDDYGTLKVMEVAKFTPLGVWLYQFLYFMFALCGGNLLGVLSTKFNDGISFAILVGYYIFPMMIYMFTVNKIDIPIIYQGQFGVFICNIIIWSISLYISLRIIIKRGDLYTE
jgi:hypothetical protein